MQKAGCKENGPPSCGKCYFGIIENWSSWGSLVDSDDVWITQVDKKLGTNLTFMFLKMATREYLIVNTQITMYSLSLIFLRLALDDPSSGLVF